MAIARWKDPDAAERLRQRIWMIADLGTLVRMNRDLSDNIAQLAIEHRLSPYDAVYVACARRLGVTLASCDERDLVTAGLAKLPATLIAH